MNEANMNDLADVSAVENNENKQEAPVRETRSLEYKLNDVFIDLDLEFFGEVIHLLYESIDNRVLGTLEFAKELQHLLRARDALNNWLLEFLKSHPSASKPMKEN